MFSFFCFKKKIAYKGELTKRRGRDACRAAAAPNPGTGGLPAQAFKASGRHDLPQGTRRLEQSGGVCGSRHVTGGRACPSTGIGSCCCEKST